MKKWGILLGIVAIISIISEVVAESKRLEEPIVLDVVMDFNTHQIYVSYLTNAIEPTMVEWIDINGNSFFPEYGGFDMFGDGYFEHVGYVNTQYYSIYDATLRMHDVQRDELLASAASLEQATIHFAGEGEPREADLLVIMPISDIAFAVNGWETGEGKMTLSVEAAETLTFTEITLANTFGKIEALVKDERKVSLPLTLQKGEELWVELEEIVAVYPLQQAYIRVSGSKGDTPFSEIRGTLIQQDPNSTWVKERVEQYHE